MDTLEFAVEDLPGAKAPTLDERYLVPGLIRGLQVLQIFGRQRQEQSVAGIAQALGLSRSTVFRLVYTLESEGYLRKVPGSKKYELSSRVMDLGFSFLANQDLSETAMPVLRALRDETDTSTHLVVREEREAVYVARFQAKTHLISTVGVGSRLPAHATAPGRVLLSGLSLAEIAALYEGADLPRFTESTPTTLSALISQVEADKTQGALVSFGFYETDVASIAAPVRDRSGRVVAAISVSCPINTYSRSEFENRIRHRVETAAYDLSYALGYRQA